ncbi:hypothetical protein G5I_10696 [Acromyrmex echinatior]|uniref:Uncharacterized protein n=1 Tax=Acromyrmex echinatior TaxID=103372 RepID=F4WXL1_ACREC|nr:hypothetical protein G5I_10696 [Acromyrmex echinatior]
MKLVYQYNRRKEVHGVLVRNPKCMTRLRGGLAIASMLTLLAAATSGILSPLTNLYRLATPSEKDDGAGIAACFSGAIRCAVQFFSGWRVICMTAGPAAPTAVCRPCLTFHEPRRCLTSSTSDSSAICRIFCRFLKSQVSGLTPEAESWKCTCALLCTGWVHRRASGVRRQSGSLSGLSCPTTSRS